jgi:ATP-dependent DNA ligase
MLAQASEVVPTDANSVIEPKLDGWRCIYAERKLWSRSGAPITQVPYIVEALMDSPEGTTLDGELILLDAPPGEHFTRTSSILKRNAEHQPTDTEPRLHYVIFDLLHCEENDLLTATLKERRLFLKLVGKLVDDSLVHVIPERAADEGAEEFYERCCEEGYEGVVAKRLDSLYVPGARNAGWTKIKPELEMDVEVTGTYPADPTSKYHGKAVGGITFRTPEGYEGRAAGMDNALREALFHDASEYTGRVAVVAYQSVGEGGALRFPRFKRFRDPADKSVADLNASPTATIFVRRAAEAEDRARQLEEQNAELRRRLEGAVKGVGATNGTSGRKRASSGPKTRNYNAMTAAKLQAAIEELEGGYGVSTDKARATEANGGWTVARHLQEAKKVRASR